jgi:nitrogen fixation/metabolism regulation signal transduction histidine kinase
MDPTIPRASPVGQPQPVWFSDGKAYIMYGTFSNPAKENIMSIRVRLFLTFLALTVLPLGILGGTNLRNIQNVKELTVAESTELMKQLGETTIQQKALDTAQQIAIYLEAHPALLTEPDLLMVDSQLAALAVQPVGMTGYTALYDDRGVVYSHSNPALVGQDMHMFEDTLPEFWAIFDASLDGTKVGSYYVWKEPDESLRDKYMECVPVEGTHLRIAATTYIDEFYAPIRETEQKAEQIYVKALTQAIVAMIAVASLALLGGWWLSSIISKPVTALVEASQAVEAGRIQDVNLREVEKRSDEMGALARVFSSMAAQVYKREQDLKEEIVDLRMKVQIFIKIDEAKKERDIREITESDYFNELMKRVDELRKSRSEE